MNKPSHPHTLYLINTGLDHVLSLRHRSGIHPIVSTDDRTESTLPRVSYKNRRIDRPSQQASPAHPASDHQQADLWKHSAGAAALAWAQLTGRELLNFSDAGLQVGGSNKTR